MTTPDDKQDKFDQYGEAVGGYMSVEQARFAAISHARENTDFYGQPYARTQIAWEVVSAEEGEDYYYVRLSWRPAGRFRGEPGIEQYAVDKELDSDGNPQIVDRQLLDEPRAKGLPVFRIGGASVLLIAIIAIAAVFASGVFGNSGGEAPPAGVPNPLVGGPTDGQPNVPVMVDVTATPTIDASLNQASGSSLALRGGMLINGRGGYMPNGFNAPPIEYHSQAVGALSGDWNTAGNHCLAQTLTDDMGYFSLSVPRTCVGEGDFIFVSLGGMPACPMVQFRPNTVVDISLMGAPDIVTCDGSSGATTFAVGSADTTTPIAPTVTPSPTETVALSVSVRPPNTSTPTSTSVNTVTPSPTLTTAPTPFPTPLINPPTQVPITKLVSGTTVEGNIEFPGQVNVFAFETGPDDAFIITINEGTAGDYMILDVFDSQGVLLGGFRAGSVSTLGEGSRGTLARQLSEGRYTVRVRHDNLGTGSYQVSFYQTSKAAGTPIAADTFTQGEIKQPGELQWYTFNARAGDGLFLVLQEDDEAEDLTLVLYDPRSLSVWKIMDSRSISTDGSADSVKLDVNLKTTGQYVLSVRRKDPLETGSYALSFNLTSQ